MNDFFKGGTQWGHRRTQTGRDLSRRQAPPPKPRFTQCITVAEGGALKKSTDDLAEMVRGLGNTSEMCGGPGGEKK